MFTILAVQPSPQFIIMSYRRACFHCQKHKPTEARPADATDTCQCEGEFNVTNGILPDTSSSTRSMVNDMIPTTAPKATSSARVSIIECQLAIIHHFLNNLPSSVFGTTRFQSEWQSSIVSTIVEHLGTKWSCMDQTKFNMNALFRKQNSDTQMTADSLLDAGLDPIVIMCLDAIGGVIKFLLQSNPTLFTSYIDVLFNRDHLFEAYASWLNEVYVIANNSLAIIYESSLSQLVMEIVKLASKLDELHLLQAKIHQLNSMEAQSTLGFDYFVAQLREAYLVAQQHPVPWNSTSTSSFSQRWLFHELTSYEHTTDLSLGSILRALFIGYGFDLLLDKTTLLVKSGLSLYCTIPAVFELDGIPHVYRVLPHGESSLSQISELSHGDYCGSIMDDDTI
ncbi:hypothetical protein THRCLA_09867, partial [Thraustotheca clavata]